MNGILLIDKPEGWTSHDVVAKLRRILGERRIGHSGTLDPMATGLLVVFVGRATRAVEFAESHEKEYIAGMRFGMSTDTQDITGAVLRESAQKPSKEELLRVLPQFRGELLQTPPMYSALKVGGKKLYELARSGVEVERKSRKVTISELEMLGEENGDYLFRVVCSKGTYIRTLCSDIGDTLGCGAALSSLRRTRAGRFSVDDAITIDKAEQLAGEGRAQELLMPVEALFGEFPALTINDKQKKKCLCGNRFSVEAEDGCYRVFDEGGSFLMLGSAENGEMSTVKSFFEV